MKFSRRSEVRWSCIVLFGGMRQVSESSLEFPNLIHLWQCPAGLLGIFYLHAQNFLQIVRISSEQHRTCCVYFPENVPCQL